MIYNLTKSIELMLFEASIFCIFLILIYKKMQISLLTVSFISSSLFKQIDKPSRPWSSMNSSRFPSCGSFLPDLSFYQNVIYSSNYWILSCVIDSLDWAIRFLLWLWNCLLVFGPASFGPASFGPASNNLDKVVWCTLCSS